MGEEKFEGVDGLQICALCRNLESDWLFKMQVRYINIFQYFLKNKYLMLCHLLELNVKCGVFFCCFKKIARYLTEHDSRMVWQAAVGRWGAVAVGRWDAVAVPPGRLKPQVFPW